MSKCLAIPKNHLENLSFWEQIRAEKDADGNINVLKPLSAEEVDEFLNLVEDSKMFHERYGETGIEENPEWQQVILYTVVKKGPHFFVYQRAKKREIQDTREKKGDERIAGKLSIGIGGHIEPFDQSLIHSFFRELNEELRFSKKQEEILLEYGNSDGIAEMRIQGMIKYELDPIGKVHVGLFCVLEVHDPEIQVSIRAEDEIMFGKFMDMEEYMNFRMNTTAEEWTNLITEHPLFLDVLA